MLQSLNTAALILCFVSGWFLSAATTAEDFRFVLLGDRTGEAQEGVYEQTWRETIEDKPEFVLTPGDTIQGLNEATARQEWRQVQQIWRPYQRIPLYLAPGNHDVWSAESAVLFRQFSHHPTHYSFDFHQAHVTVLDNSRSDHFSSEELQFLKQDLQAHAGQTVKIIVSHRPSWLFSALFGNVNTPVHQIAKQYGARYVIAGHVHQILHFELDGITYLSLPSAGGHLRGSKRYEDGWFFAHTVVQVKGDQLNFQIKEIGQPHGQGRTTVLSDWGAAGLLKRIP